jgi:molybdopterin-synthase adenylyltransferase
VNDRQLLRYSRHILLPQIDIEGQEALICSRALIIGAGGLGSPVAMYLAASGIGKLIICDNDNVDLTNLQRQIIHSSAAIGTPKTLSAKKTLAGINPEVDVVSLQDYMSENQLQQLAAEVDIVIDASDNFDTRHLINKACVNNKKPLVSGAVVRFEGQITVFDLRHQDSPCYHCLFPVQEGADDMHCATLGVFSPLAGIIGCMQAAEALKILLGIGETLNGRLMLLDGLTAKWRSIKLTKDVACAVCRISASAAVGAK